MMIAMAPPVAATYYYKHTGTHIMDGRWESTTNRCRATVITSIGTLVQIADGCAYTDGRVVVSFAPQPRPKTAVDGLRENIALMQSQPVQTMSAAPAHFQAVLLPHPQPCTGLKSLNMIRAGAQIANAFVVASAVHHGATQRVGGYGSGQSMLATLAIQGIIDYIADRATARASCGVQRAERWYLTIAPVVNAGSTEARPR